VLFDEGVRNLEAPERFDLPLRGAVPIESSPQRGAPMRRPSDLAMRAQSGSS
jgi:hypothetical protein